MSNTSILKDLQSGLIWKPSAPPPPKITGQNPDLTFKQKLTNLVGKGVSTLKNISKNTAITDALGVAGSMLGSKDAEFTGKSAGIAGSISNTVSGVMSKINPMGSAIVSLGGSIGKMIGGNEDRVEGVGSAIANTASQIASNFGTVGQIAGAAISILNGIGGKRAKSFNDLSNQYSSDFAGSAGDVRNVHNKYSNKKAGLFDIGFAKRGNREIDRVLGIQNQIKNIQDKNDRLKNNNIGSDLNSAILNKYQGNQQLTLAKKGVKFPDLESARNILNSIKSKDIQSFKSGGKIEKENIIPTGALHKNLHHIEEANPELEGKITKKGIPVGTYEDGGEFSQNAEIESGEIIYSLDVTKQIEEYWNNYKESGSDNIAIECGKYLVDQIFNNTRDDDKVIKKTE